ncbi:hypothetical protein V2A60_007130 [Cordyceps javanica]|uniref:Uncharacterized protein n=1 Tax=Cordyceps javanica TaxID=43265 RepID=A0A545USL2_9HYPO|nr:hypothetical protein IF1G_08954 [Cordyceps javanica]TQW04322.1 hypothetical protein IF2G_08092 [Cordyceps javanica]
MSRHRSLREAKLRLLDEFYRAGHVTVKEEHPDETHPLHDLFLKTMFITDKKSLLDGRNGSFKLFRRNKVCQLFGVIERHNLQGEDCELDKLESEALPNLPSNEEMLAIKFATKDQAHNKEVIRLLELCNSKHLWQIPLPANAEGKDTAAKIPTKDFDSDSAPADMMSKVAAKGELDDLDRKIKAIQSTKKGIREKLQGLKEDLATVEAAESVVLQAKEAMENVQAAESVVLQAKEAMENVQAAESALLQAKEAFTKAQAAVAEADRALVESSNEVARHGQVAAGATV